MFPGKNENKILEDNSRKLPLRKVSTAALMIVPPFGPMILFNPDQFTYDGASYLWTYNGDVITTEPTIFDAISTSYFVAIPISQTITNEWTESLKHLFYEKFFIDKRLNSLRQDRDDVEKIMRIFMEIVGSRIAVGTVYKFRETNSYAAALPYIDEVKTI